MRDFLKRLFAPSPDEQCARLLSKLAECAVHAAKCLEQTNGADLKEITKYEHEGDKIVREVHQVVDGAFLMRIDKADITRLLHELDDVIDGMRKVASHIDIYRVKLHTLRGEAKELMRIIAETSGEVEKLVNVLREKRPSLSLVNDSVHNLHLSETKADRILMTAEKSLVEAFDKPNTDMLAYIAWEKLFRLLEQVTDSANHCGLIVLSIVRREV